MVEGKKMSEKEKKYEQKEESEEALIPWKEFLEEYPIDSIQKVSEFYEETDSQYRPLKRKAPILRLWCWNENCKGIRNFSGRWEHDPNVSDFSIYNDFLIYTCKDCGESKKTFCIIAQIIDREGNGKVIKIGEFPEQHIDIPSGLPKLMGDDYSTFVKGLKCEKQGLGIGAFSYYRRVVENQKVRLLIKILEASRRLNAPTEALKLLEDATKEDQFSKAIDMMKNAIPVSLLVDGHNPLKLVHKALSAGIHEMADEKCLELAHSIRMVLSALAERIQQALRDQRKLKSAVSTLLDFQKDAKKSRDTEKLSDNKKNEDTD